MSFVMIQDNRIVPRGCLVPYFSNYFLSRATTTTSHHEIGDRGAGPGEDYPDYNVRTQPPPATPDKIPLVFQHRDFALGIIKKYCTFCFSRDLKSLQSSHITMRTTHTCYIMLGSLASHWSDFVTQRSDWLEMTADCEEKNWSELKTIVATTDRVSQSAHLCER